MPAAAGRHPFLHAASPGWQPLAALRARRLTALCLQLICCLRSSPHRTQPLFSTPCTLSPPLTSMMRVDCVREGFQNQLADTVEANRARGNTLGVLMDTVDLLTGTHEHKHAHTQARAHTHTHTHTRSHARLCSQIRHTDSHTYTHARTHTHTHTHNRRNREREIEIHSHAFGNTYNYTQAHTHARTHTRARALTHTMQLLSHSLYRIVVMNSFTWVTSSQTTAFGR
jgi:hypothetical protein